jgi:tRNA A-37 threonylcarbamoyl transferase component Bud32/tetratricopeptide (TPR) repeat protein
MADRDVAGSRLTKLGRYEVLSELGKGAMGVVYLARDPVIGRMVAIKTIKAASMGDDDSESREFRERFVREAQTAGILSHPNIVTIHDIGEDPETRISFIAMEYIEGKTLKGFLLEKTQFTWDQIANMVAQVAEAMDYAHRKGIIHRDIKPANIIVTADEKVKITDFGIAKIASSNLTSTGQFLGTPNYMSPEQVSGSPVDGRSDIFSLGVVLYELLTRRKPFIGDNLTAISYKIVHEDFTPPADLSTDIPAEFNAIVARAMAKDPWNRYQRGKDLALALQQLRAHLEEQKNLAELGTIVSNTDSVATEKMVDLAAIAAEGAREAAEASASRGAQPTPAAVSEVPTAAEASAPEAARPEPVVVSVPEPAPEGPPTAKLPLAPGETTLSKRLREPVKPASFWMAAAAAVVLLLVAGVLFVRRAAVSRPSVPFDGARAKVVGQQWQDLEEGKKLYAAGRYQESLDLFRRVLAKDPNSKPARQYAQMAEAALQGRQEAARKSADAEKAVRLAQAAIGSGDYKEAKARAEEALALEPGSTDAQKVRDEASAKIAEAEAAKKKQERLAAARKPTAPAKGKGASVARLQPTAAPASTSASSTPTLRLLFNSPISEGHVMVAVNDQILLRRPFKFSRKEGLFKTIKETGTVDASIPVQAGALNVKVWLSGPDIPASTYASTATQMPAGGSRILRLDYTDGHLSARIQ